MEYVDGETLSDKINQGPLKLQDAIKIATQIAEGLQAAHEKKITHHDIKCQNIMLTGRGDVKIMDFGLAKLSGRSMVTKAGTTLGTVSYMSPEQARGESADYRSDIWSLGVVLYEMVSGQLPFKGDYEQEDPEPLTALRSGVPIALDGIIAKALAKDPAMRYQHVDELPADLRGITLATSGISRIATAEVPGSARQAHWVQKWGLGLAMGLVLGIAATWLVLRGFAGPQSEIPSIEPVIRSTLELSLHAPLMTVGVAPLGVDRPALALFT